MAQIRSEKEQPKRFGKLDPHTRELLQYYLKLRREIDDKAAAGEKAPLVEKAKAPADRGFLDGILLSFGAKERRAMSARPQLSRAFQRRQVPAAWRRDIETLDHLLSVC